MKTDRVDPEICKRYLLGGLDPETEELDSRLMLGDPSVENQLGATEDELIDAFILGELNTEDAESFRQYFLRSAVRRQNLTFAEGFHRYVNRYWQATPDSRSVEQATDQEATQGQRRRFRWQWIQTPGPAWSYGLAALWLITLIGGLWIFAGNLQLEGQLEQMQNEMARLEQAPTATVRLSPGLLRGMGEVERLILPREVSLVRVQLDIGVDDYGSYRAALKDADGDELWTQSQLAATSGVDKTTVDLALPAELMPQGDYSIRLSGLSTTGDLELVGRYYFRVLES
jgi:hypothetical protein